MPAEYKATFYSTDINRKCRIFSSSMNYDNEEVHYWRDNFTHHCYPPEDQLQLWPEKPIRYREVVSAYSVEVRELMLRMLDLIGEGLGLKLGYFDGELSKNQLFNVLFQDFQVLRKGEWMTVEPMPNAFFLLAALQLKVISNGKFTSPIHRVITHQKEGRTTIGRFLIPAHDMLIEPANKDDHAADDAPLYRCFTYKEFYSTFTKNICDADFALEYFKNKTK
ncbi:Hyoscyamine 6-dioxygenase [Sesamum alatum]|uniref:Hyoscyamine 6-dioxygenase n=1 Tax=Sesamum alatum TaxID=300844 RepID=A0AAE1Z4Z8_9LAMI|nr:Hyoscyamine 6-dioxygenase [Sesamum alatum]